MNANEQEIRAIAEAILTNSSSSNQNMIRPSPSHHSYNVNSRPDYLVTTDFITGARQGGRMSLVRRFFCLIVTFDLLFTVLVWLICLMWAGGDVFTALSKQVVHYNIHSSMFDIVMGAASRFTVLLLFYGFLSINHWCIIAVSTASTCAFLIAKVFVYNWAVANQPVMQVLLILTSFVLSWGEAWFLDFRVMPQESQAEFFQGLAQNSESERAPLLRNFLRGLTDHGDYESLGTGEFHSPIDSAEGSGDEGDGHSQRPSTARHKTGVGTSHQDAKLRAEATEIFDKSWKTLNSEDWKLEKQTSEGYTVHSKTLTEAKKVFKFTGVFNFPATLLFKELTQGIENIPSWNPTLIESRSIQKVDDHTDVCYQVSAAGAGGIVKSRDFVNLRRWGERDGCLVAAGASVAHPKVPPCTEYIRGENGPGCWAMRPVRGEAAQCVFQWLLDTNLKGWIPHHIVDTALTTAMLDYAGHLRSYSSNLESSGAF